VQPPWCASQASHCSTYIFYLWLHRPVLAVGFKNSLSSVRVLIKASYIDFTDLGLIPLSFYARRCWLGGRKGIRPVKTEWWGAGMVISLERGADLHMTQLMPLPLTISCSSKSRLVIPEWFCFSGAGLPRLSWKKAVKRT